VDIHEHQAKELLATFGVPVPKGGVADTPDEAVNRAEEIGGEQWAVKAQVHAGGRGKAGGIRICSNRHDVHVAAADLLGRRLTTSQTGAAGKVVNRIYVEEAVPIDRELYIGLVLDRRLERVCVLASGQGGMEIEEIAARAPRGLLREVVEPAVGMQPFQARELAYALGLRPPEVSAFVHTTIGAYRAFRDLDATMVEINPLVVTRSGRVLALDVKMSFDDNALFRRPGIAQLRDDTQEDPREAEAAHHGLSYVALDGEVGCIVNGAGLAMATMDLIDQAGGRAANFLDVGGGASPERVGHAFRLVLSDPRVKAVLVNIFAGINRCDWVARGVVQAAREVGVKVPLVVRLAGTHVEEGRRILRDSGMQITSAVGLKDAAECAVAALRPSPTTLLAVDGTI
jgi:malate-CoA ligase subunit beta